ncbi:hypothetical protein P7H22_10025 [Paenibacillus larvae]|nr:hypothetical protein [Paenibacillus larvae]MDT2240592.1 hypothetical protein [Paenibacillus larvae]
MDKHTELAKVTAAMQQNQRAPNGRTLPSDLFAFERHIHEGDRWTF